MAKRRVGRYPNGFKRMEVERPSCRRASVIIDGPALIEVLVSRPELSMPPTISLEETKGFGLFILKAVLSGCGDEIIDLAKIKLFR